MAQVTLAGSAAAPGSAPPKARRFPGLLAGWSPVLAAGGLLLQALRAGLPASSAGRALAAVLVTQMLPGVSLWRCVRPLRGWWIEDVAMGFALGVMIAVPAQTLAGLTGIPAIAGGFGPAVAAALWAIPGTRHRIREAITEPLPMWWAPAVAAVSLFGVTQLRSAYRLTPLSWPAGFRTSYVDTYFHLSLAAELAHRGPTTFPWVASEPLAYHWFSHAWIAQVSVASGAPLDEVLLRFTPALMPLLVAFVVAAAALRLTGRAWAGPLAALLTLAGGDLNVFGKASPDDYSHAVDALSPSLGLAAPSLIAVVVVIGLYWGGQMRGGGLLLVPVLTLMATGAKGSATPLLLAGLVLAAAAMLVANRSALRSVLVPLGLVLGALALAVVVVFRGSEPGLHFAPLAALRQTPAAIWFGGARGAGMLAVVAVVTMAAVLSRGLGVLGALGSRAGRRDPLPWLFAGAGLAAAGAVVTLSHPSLSQWYFARSAAPLLALGSAVGLVALADRLGPRMGPAAVVGVLAGPALCLLPAAVFGSVTPGSGLPRAALLVGVAGVVLISAAGAVAAGSARGRVALAGTAGATVLVAVLAGGVSQVAKDQVTTAPAPPSKPVSASAPLAVSRDQVNAARWIRDHSDVDDLVMTNRHCITPVAPRRCDSRWWVVAAYSERQMLLEGWTGTPRAAAIGDRTKNRDHAAIYVDYWHPDLLRLNDGFIAHPDATALRRLQALGVRWVFVDHTRPHATTLAPYAVPRLRNPGVDVYEIPPTSKP
ncbi:MAG: hypothetical protein ABJC62_04940 [Frankiaceae bacterium]